MKASEAQLRANKEYKKKSVKQVILRHYPKDEALYQKSKRLGTPKIKELIEQYKE